MKRINRCLNANVLDICQRVVQLEDMNKKVRRFLPDALSESCYVGSFTKGCLVIVTPDPVWASQLRYCIPDLRDKLRSEAGIYQLTSIKVTVSIDSVTSAIDTKKNKRANSISNKSREIISNQAKLCDYNPLKEALERLAETL